MKKHTIRLTGLGIVITAVISIALLVNASAAAPFTPSFSTPPDESLMDRWLRQQGCADLFVRTSLPAKCRGADGHWISLGQDIMPRVVTPTP